MGAATGVLRLRRTLFGDRGEPFDLPAKDGAAAANCFVEGSLRLRLPPPHQIVPIFHAQNFNPRPHAVAAA